MKAMLLAGSVLLLGVGIVWAGQSDVHRAGVHTWMAPASANAAMNPVANRPEVTAGGSKLFQERCSNCHGDDARGTPRGPDRLMCR